MDPNNPRPIDLEDNQLKARFRVVEYFNENVEKTDAKVIGLDDTYVVMWAFILGGWKALISTTVPDGMYYEITYNEPKGETYLDAYKKWENVCYKDDESG